MIDTNAMSYINKNTRKLHTNRGKRILPYSMCENDVTEMFFCYRL